MHFYLILTKPDDFYIFTAVIIFLLFCKIVKLLCKKNIFCNGSLSLCFFFFLVVQLLNFILWYIKVLLFLFEVQNYFFKKKYVFRKFLLKPFCINKKKCKTIFFVNLNNTFFEIINNLEIHAHNISIVLIFIGDISPRKSVVPF